MLAPKVAGAWNVHETNARDVAGLFVLFSSVSAMVACTGTGELCCSQCVSTHSHTIAAQRDFQR